MDSGRVEGFDISPHQRVLWPWQRKSVEYCVQAVVLIEGRLAAGAVEEAARALAGDHEILRTTFHAPPGAPLPVQVVAEDAAMPVSCFDLTVSSSSEREERVEELMAADRDRPFDFQRGPLLRLSLLAFSEDQHLLLATAPALCADGWALKNVIRDLGRWCAGEMDGEDQAPIQYADFAAWQIELEEEEDEEGRLYWSRQGTANLRLAYEQRAFTAADFVPRRVPVRVTAATLGRCADVARRYDSSLEAFLLTCWQILLARQSGSGEVTIGCLSDGREHEPLHDAVGLFEKLLPARVELSAGTRFDHALARATRSLDSNEQWRESFSWELGAGSAAVSPAEPGFFDLAFHFESRPARWTSGEMTLALRELVSCTAPFGLKLTGTALADGSRLELHYDSSRFEAAGVWQLARQLATLVEKAAGNPEATAAELALPGDAESHWLRQTYNDTAREVDSRATILELFEAQAARAPKAPAVAYCGRPETEGGRSETVSYGELDRRANHLAHELVERGVGSEVRVGLCLERSVDMVACALAVWKAGGAWVALDPDAPPSRLAALLQTTAARLVVAHERWEDALPPGIEVVLLERAAAGIAARPDTPPARRTHSDQLAYVVSTSGSTGEPKAIATTHRNAVNYLSFVAENYRLSARDAVLQVTSQAFDAAVRDTFSSLIAGARVVVLDALEAISPPAILARLEEQRITALLAVVPTLLRELLGAADRRDSSFDDLRLILASGESLYLRDGVRVAEAFGAGVQLVNQYGPTECTMTSTWWPVVAASGDQGAAPLGQPISNARVYVLDSALRLTPIGATGELCIAGAGLARGYLGRPVLTAGAFRPDPLGGEPGSRLYLTGDLARFLPGGRLEFGGRIDHQVKIRGVRIEPAEVETALRRHPAVRAAAVTARDDLPAARGRQAATLVAYLVADGAMPAEAELRGFLQQSLPPYMVPAVFVTLRSMPQTPGGKIDRAALPAPQAAQADYVAPRTPVEEQLVGIWQEVLELERVGVRDSFFAIGGHSLLATQVGARIRDAFGVELPLRTLFEARTVAELADLVVQEQLQQVGDAEVDELLRRVEQMSGAVGPGEDV